MPGVPHEMQDMLERAVLPDLRRRSGDASVIASRVLRTWGDSESGLDERLRDVITRLDDAGNPTLAFLASGWEGLKIRLTAKASTAAEAGELLAGWETEIRTLLGPHRVRLRRRHDGVRRPRPPTAAWAHAGTGRVGDAAGWCRPA